MSGKNDNIQARNSKEKIVIVADDLTGAGDTVVQFGRSGLKCMVITSGNAAEAIDRCDVLAVNTDSRFDDFSSAYRKVYKAGKSLRGRNIRLIYKKIDSTMRGNPGAEISALMDSMDISHAIIAPALPVYGRTTVDGNVYLNDILLENTEFSRDPVSPVKASFIPDILSSQTSKPISLIKYQTVEKGEDHLLRSIEDQFSLGSELLIIDAKTDADLRIIASCLNSIKETVVFAGCSGLATALSRNIRLSQEDKISIVIAGSASDTTRRQLNSAMQELQVVMIDVDTQKIISGRSNPETARIMKLVREASDRLNDVIIRTSPDKNTVDETAAAGRNSGLSGSRVSEMISTFLGKLAKQIISEINVKGLVLTGGDTAIKALKSLGVKETVILGEIEEGIPFGYMNKEGYNGVTIVTKAGGFGNEGAIVKILRFLKGKK